MHNLVLPFSYFQEAKATGGKERGWWSQSALGQIRASPLTSSVTLGSSLNLSVSQFLT